MSFSTLVNLSKIKYLLFVWLLLSCREPQNELLQAVAQEFSSLPEHYVLMVISQSDCSQCVIRLQDVVSDFEKKRVPIYGIYHGERRTVQKSVQGFMKQTTRKVVWKRSNRMELMNALYHTSKQITGPYVVEIQKGSVVFR